MAEDVDVVGRIVTQAEEAFWAVVAARFVDAKSGDLSPDASITFTAACRAVVERWLVENLPDGVEPRIADADAEPWLSIESMPKDGREVWLLVPDDKPDQVVGYWSRDGGGYLAYADEALNNIAGGVVGATRWRPKPSGPRSQG